MSTEPSIWQKISKIDTYGGIGSNVEVIDGIKDYFQKNTIHIEAELAKKIQEMISLNYNVYYDNKEVHIHERNMDMKKHSETSDNIYKNEERIKILYQEIEKLIQKCLTSEETK
jgi:hypothetical protein